MVFLRCECALKALMELVGLPFRGDPARAAAFRLTKGSHYHLMLSVEQW